MYLWKISVEIIFYSKNNKINRHLILLITNKRNKFNAYISQKIIIKALFYLYINDFRSYNYFYIDM